MSPVPVPAFVYFDLGNVLVRFDHEIAVRQLAKLCGASNSSIRELVFQGDLQSDYERGAISTGEFCDLFRKHFACSTTNAEICFAASDIFWLNESIVPLLDSLNKANIRIGILSNTCDAHWQYLLERFASIIGRFPIHVLSFEVKSSKPECSIFEHAAKKAGLKTSQLFFTDDIEENVQGAIAAGVDAVLFKSVDLLESQLRERGLNF